MIKKYFAALSATALIGVAPYALAASSTDLTVTGLITPSACTPSLSEGGIVDHGKIPSKDLFEDKNTRLADKTLKLSVSCDAPVAFWMNPIDNQLDTAINYLTFGLGKINGDQKLGAVEVAFINPMADGVGVRPIRSTNDGATWTPANKLYPVGITSFKSLTGPWAPTAMKDLEVDLEIQTTIARADSLDLTNEVALDGSVTIEIHY